MKEIPLTQGYVALVDDEDYEELAGFSWCGFPYRNTAYAFRGGRKGESITVRMHRQILNVASGVYVDHINGNGLDNRRRNLRIATSSQNMGNMRSRTGTSCFKGVYWDRSAGRWGASIQCNHERCFLGYFNNETEAAATYDKKAKELFKEFARLNLQAPVREAVV